jgi:hypothetical protein
VGHLVEHIYRLVIHAIIINTLLLVLRLSSVRSPGLSIAWCHNYLCCGGTGSGSRVGNAPTQVPTRASYRPVAHDARLLFLEESIS